MKSYNTSLHGDGTYWTDDHHTGVMTEHAMVSDSRWHHRFGASWIRSTDICLERARLEGTDEMPDVNADAAQIGTSVHTAIQYAVDEGGDVSLAEMLDVFAMDFDYESTRPTFAWIKYTERTALKFGAKCVQQWYEQVLPTLDLSHCWTEREFVLPFVDNDERVIELSGAIDFGPQLRDWKTAGREYKPWEYRRWAVQPTVYTWAACEMGLTDAFERYVDRVPFEYVVMGGKEVQRFTVERGADDWDFLTDKVTRVAEMIEAEMPRWPTNDNHALCSEKWCPAWGQCKGRF